MSTIRPLATIAILAALGVFLAVKINESPSVALNDDWPDQAAPDGDAPAWPAVEIGGAEETPEANAIGSSLETRTAPAWDTPPAAPPAPTGPKLEAVEDHPAFPDLPELPPLDGLQAGSDADPAASAADDSTASATVPLPTATDEKLNLPDVIPQAKYSGAPEASADAALDLAMPAIQAALDRDELTRAHLMLSQWMNEPGLSPRRRQEVESLLGQLAGTVVYSMEHRLSPPHVVAPGETLATIAQQYGVPWQLLAKINGVATAEGVEAGQTLKVIRGPFAADVRLDTGELVLTVGGRYAGKFPVRVEGGAPEVGQWRVGQKRLDPAAGPALAGPSLGGSTLEPKIVLEDGAGKRFELSAGAAPPAEASGRLTIASADLSDVYDILSVGSSVSIRR